MSQFGHEDEDADGNTVWAFGSLELSHSRRTALLREAAVLAETVAGLMDGVSGWKDEERPALLDLASRIHNELAYP